MLPEKYFYPARFPMLIHLKVAFPCLIILHCAITCSYAESLLADNNPYQHVKILDPEGKYRLEWVVDWRKEQVTFNVTVETLGWVGFGIAMRPEMDGADMVIGGVDRNKRVYFSDRHGVGDQIPVVDRKQDWVLHSAWESSTHTSLSFSRAFDTCDPNDIPINDDARDLLWAYGQTDDINEYHYANRGAVPMYLRDPDLTPRSIQEGKNDTEAASESHAKLWTLKRTFNIPTKRTTYWCTIHKLDLPRKHHLIGCTFKINNETKLNMHHTFVFRCIIPNPSTVFEQFVDYPGEECYSQTRQLGRIPVRSCIELKIGHAIGGHAFFFPDVMGIPIGATEQSEYFLWQVHYDNPTGRNDLVSEIELNMYYTSNLRPTDGGILSLGQHIPGSPSILLPPHSINHSIYGHCSSNCTRKMLPPTGIKFVAALLHSHNAGSKLTLQHFRDDRELSPILHDDNYMPTFQPARMLRKERAILPGDHIIMRCVYATSYTNRTTIGGYGADQEMCIAFGIYYNYLPDYTICRSELISPSYLAHYLAGTTNVTWDQPHLEYAATAPPNLAGMTLTEISDSLVNWNSQLRSDLQKDHTFHPQVEICPGTKEGMPEQPTFVTNPTTQINEHTPPPSCSPHSGDSLQLMS